LLNSWQTSRRHLCQFLYVHSVTAEVSNLDQLFFTNGAIKMLETSTSSL
jgi:hypothetical protein